MYEENGQLKTWYLVATSLVLAIINFLVFWYFGGVPVATIINFFTIKVIVDKEREAKENDKFK